MSLRKLGTFIFGTMLLISIAVTIYLGLNGYEVGFNEVIIIGSLAGILLSSLTWGSKKRKDGILEDEELGRKITEKSSKISYAILASIIIIAAFLDFLVNETLNPFLLAILGLSIITLPLVEFIVARRYQ